MIPPILREFPDQFETERLLIRAPRAGDGMAIYEGITESLAELKPWMPWAWETPKPEISEELARRNAARFATREDLALLIFRKADQQFVGGTGLHRIHWEIPSFEIGYWIRTSLHGQGYITEAVRGLTRFAFDLLGAQRCEIHCDFANTRSAAVALRAEYVSEAHLRNHRRNTSGELSDTQIFGLTRADYEARSYPPITFASQDR